MTLSIAIVFLVGVLGAANSSAQAPGFKRVELQRHDLTTQGREAVLARAEFQPGGMAPKHTHPGEEVGYVLEGEVVLEIEGKPAMKLKAGDSFVVPAGQVHSAKNPTKKPSAVLSTYIIEKDKPLATPVK
ncbi:MAG TPA: cupin domain-containing protein [Kofleriaceae bacterium]|jgi:quercetin dioxygenase-like cupin family protein|nr:cupin domain-containing protein [Kofleriaceae bacterium]